MTQQPINVMRARALRASGLSWRRVGERLAFEEQRPLPYQGPAVQTAVTRDSKLLVESDYYRITGRRVEL